MAFRKFMLLAFSFSLLFCAAPIRAQLGNSGSIEGVVKDQSGSAVTNATVEIAYGVSGFQRTATTGSDGTFRFTNVPFNNYHMVVTAPGFASYTQDVDVRSTVPVSVPLTLKIGTAETSVTVEATGGDLVENESTFHTDVDRGLFVLFIACHSGVPRCGRGLERPDAWAGRPRGEFLFRRRTTVYRPIQ